MTDETKCSVSRHVFYASRVGATLDSDVIDGGGTDDTEVLQAILDKAPSLGSVHLIMDGASLVRGLDIHSNTTLECMNPSCGFFLADDCHREIVRNAHPHATERLDRNISILGGTYNHNYYGHGDLRFDPESNVCIVALSFFGIENLTVRDITIRNQRTYAIHVANWFRVNMENVAIDLPVKVDAQNQDGIHISGPGQFLTMRHIQGCAWDDFIAIDPDGGAEFDDDGNITQADKYGATLGHGPISDVLIDGVLINDAAQGIRLLSREFRLDRVVIRNVVGTYRSYGCFINPWHNGRGNIGNIIFDTIDLRQAEPNYDYLPPFLFSLGGKIENLTLKNIYHHQPSDNRPLVIVEKEGDVGVLTIDGLRIYESDSSASDMTAISVDGKVGRLIVRDAQVTRAPEVPQEGCLIETTAADHPHGIEHLFLSDVAVNRMHSLLRHRAGSIGTIQANNVSCNDMADTVISVEKGTIGELRSNAVYGAELGWNQER